MRLNNAWSISHHFMKEVGSELEIVEVSLGLTTALLCNIRLPHIDLTMTQQDTLHNL